MVLWATAEAYIEQVAPDSELLLPSASIYFPTIPHKWMFAIPSYGEKWYAALLLLIRILICPLGMWNFLHGLLEIRKSLEKGQDTAVTNRQLAESSRTDYCERWVCIKNYILLSFIIQNILCQTAALRRASALERVGVERNQTKPIKQFFKN